MHRMNVAIKFVKQMIACTLFLPIFTAAKDEKYFSLNYSSTLSGPLPKNSQNLSEQCHVPITLVNVSNKDFKRVQWILIIVETYHKM